MSTEIYKLTT